MALAGTKTVNNDWSLIVSSTILDAISAGGWDLTEPEDARWLLSQDAEWSDLIDKAQDLIDEEQDKQDAIDEAIYQEQFGSDE